MKKVDILLPCYNEELTIVKCIKRIKKVMDKERYDYRIVVCDNNSSDKSKSLAKKEGVLVITEKQKGYGSTLLNGINNSNADYIVMLDCDLSYNEKHIIKMLKLLDKYDLVIGNRFKGNIEKNAMPLSHRFGSKILTEYANLLFRTSCHDYHCGLRAFKKKEILKCNLVSKGFEFASEMIIKARLNKLKIKEVSTDLFKDGRNRKPHLRTIRDGFRHLFLINKVKFQSSAIFKYISTFLILIFSMLFCLFISSLIPNKYIYDNTLKSFDFFEKYSSKINSMDKDIILLERCGDVRNISMAYNMDYKNPIDSIIRMSYLKEVDKIQNLREVFINQEGEVVNYSRYWQGQAMYSKIMLLFMPLGYFMYIIQLIVLLILFFLIIKKLIKKSLPLSLAFIFMCLSTNLFFTAFSVQYFFSTLLMFLFSYILIRLYENNSNYIGVMFAVSGALTCFFDFLTCETLTLTVPLFIYIFFSIDKNKKHLFKEIIKYIFIWGMFYCCTFLTKWIISILYFGFDYIKVIFDHALIRVTDNGFPFYVRFAKTFLLTFNNLIPFNFFNDGMVFVVILLLFALHILIFDYKKYILLLIPVIIPFIRFFALSTHSFYFYYFTYRALGVLVLFMFIMLYFKIRDIFFNRKKAFCK